MILAVVVVAGVIAAGPSSDSTTQTTVIVTLIASVLGTIGVVLKLIRDGRKREKGEDSLLEQQRTQLYDPTLADLIACRNQRDRLSRQRETLITYVQEHELPVPPEAYL